MVWISLLSQVSDEGEAAIERDKNRKLQSQLTETENELARTKSEKDAMETKFKEFSTMSEKGLAENKWLSAWVDAKEKELEKKEDELRKKQLELAEM